MYKLDELEQYVRRQNLRIYNVPEVQDENDDGEEIVLKIAKELKHKLCKLDIQSSAQIGQARQ